MARVKVGFLCSHTRTPVDDFPITFSAWDAGVSDPLVQTTGSPALTKHETARTKHTRTITSEGLYGPAHVEYLRVPPRYPPFRGELNESDGTLCDTIGAHAHYIVLVVEQIDGGGVPVGWENMTRNDPIAQAKWTEVRDGLVTRTTNVIGADEGALVAAFLDGLKADNPDITPKELFTALRNY